MDDNQAQFDSGDGFQLASAPGQVSDDFTKQVADYFGSYVSGTLSSKGLPLRIHTDTYDAGLLRKLDLDRYPQLSKNIYKNFVSGLGQQTFVITQNKYTARQDEHILYLLSENIDSITETELSPLLHVLSSQAETKLVEVTDEGYTDAVSELLDISKKAISDDFVVPFILPLKEVDIVANKKTKDAMALLHEAAVSRLYDASKELLKHIYIAYFASDTYISKESLTATLADALTPKLVKDSLAIYLEHLRIDDAYQHVYALHRRTVVSDDQALFVYFGELQYDQQSYPLFYTKVASSHALPSITLTFENRIFVNKQAIEYVVRHLAARTNQTIDTTSLQIPDVIYSADEIERLQQLITRLQKVLKLSDPIELAKSTFQQSTNRLVTLTNKIYFAVATSYGLAIADDYASILRNESLAKKTERYLEALLIKPTARFVDDITETWEKKSHFEKLLPTIPLTVNDEQRQVLMALEKAGCEHIVVDAADNTGKKHLINAALLTGLSKGETVLVTGRHSISAQTLRDDIGNILQQTSGSNGHNPVLDLRDSEALERIDEQVLSDVGASVRLIDGKVSDLAVAKKRKKQALKDDFNRFVQSAENINLHEVERTITNERKFAGRNWIEDEPLEEVSTGIQQLHRSIQYVRSSDASYLMPYVDPSQRKAIDDFISAYKQYEKASRDVQSRQPQFIVRYKKLLPDQRTHMQESLAYIQSNYRQFVKILSEQPASSWLEITDNSTFQQIALQDTVFSRVHAIAQNARLYFKSGDKMMLLHELNSYTASSTEIIDALDTYIEQIATLKSKLFGFSGRMLVVENLNKQLMKSLPAFHLPDPEKQTENMQIMSDFVRYATEELAAAGLSTDYWKEVVHILLSDKNKIEEIRQLLASLNQTSRFDFMYNFKLHEADNLLANITLLEYATALNRVYSSFPKLGKLFGITGLNHLLARPHEFMARVTKLSRDLNEANQLDEAKQTIKTFIDQYPGVNKRLGVGFANNNLDITDETFANSSADYIKEYIAHKKKEQDVRAYFDDVAIDSFAHDSAEYRQILGVELQHAVNRAMLQVMTEQAKLASTVTTALKDQRKLSSEDAAAVLRLFPAIAGDIHTLSAVLPLDSAVFDLVIIDAADTISIAEVLPAVLRAKKVLVIGDSAQATAAAVPLQDAANVLYKNQLSVAIKERLSSEPADSKNGIIAKQDATFVANKSALEFFAGYANYELSLKKQYGVYEELASFGNKYYYDDSLISLMSRTVPLKNLFTFTQVKPTQDQVSRFTNSAEIERIIEQLHTMKDEGYSGTISIVTPFAEQAALLQKELDECVITDWFERRELRVMTFDGRRQRASDYTFYSLVASDTFNELSQVFPSSVGFEAFPGDTRSHRLLTGFSGNKQSIHIVHSLAFEDYGGSLSETLQHFSTKLRGPVVTVKGSSTDILLPTETNMRQAFERTNLARKYEGRVSFITKYPFINYIKPLSPNYHKASYKVFFLIMIDNQPLVIEFDDFKERFLQSSKDPGGIYLTAQDTYGYKLLEGYGYRFLRLNKFTIGNNPTETLDSYLSELTKTPTWPFDNGFVV